MATLHTIVLCLWTTVHSPQLAHLTLRSHAAVGDAPYGKYDVRACADSHVALCPFIGIGSSIMVAQK